MLTSNSALNQILSSALNYVIAYLQSFAQTTQYEQNMALTFADNLTADIAQSYQQLWNSSDFSLETVIEIRSQSELNGANGAFSRDTEKIYLSDAFLTQNAHHLETIAALILEEYGHLIDAEVNPIETIGDEGAIFARLVQGREITAEELQ